GEEAAEGAGPKLGTGAHEHAARRSAMGDDLVGRGPSLLDQVRRGRDEIAERVWLMRKLAFAVPAPAFFGAAAHVRDGIDEPAVDQREPAGAERSRHRHAVSAVAVEEARRGPVERKAF